MKQVLTIYRKEMRDMLRDRRSILRMFIIPLAVFPALFGIMNAIQSNSNETELNRSLRIGFHSNGNDLGLRQFLKGTAKFEVYDAPNSDSIRLWIRSNRLDVGVSLPDDFGNKVSELLTGKIFTYGAASSDIANGRLDTSIDLFEQQLLDLRLKSLHLTLENIQPTQTEFINTASMRETIGKLAGGFLPYIFIIFCYMGCMFPAIDLFTGEKERGTIETLLSAPVDRWKILIGKMLVIITAGLLSALLSMVGLFLGIKMAGSGVGELIDVALAVLSPASIAALVAMLFPLVVFFAGLMIPATVYAKSFKEAATTLQPLNFVVIMPAAIGMMPGIELNATTALVPILNVTLITKEIIAGTMNGLYFAEAVASLFLLATLAVGFSFKRFGNEKNILRN
jgi:sodium transport system permease protein